MRLGIYGGTFNPPHLGHIRAAAQALEALNLDRLLVIPDRIAPHKVIPEGSPNPAQRLEMVQLATAAFSGMEASDLELRREGPSYTYLTVEALAREHPGDELFLLMGTDMFLSFRSWRYPERITAHAALAVFCRGEKGEREAIAEEKARMEAEGIRVFLIQNSVTAISSTDLRRMLVFRCAGEFLDPNVEQYIYGHGLYGTGRDLRNLPVDLLQETVVSLLKPSRVNHVLGCRQAAVELARLHGADETHAARAALLHDITKALDGPLQLTLCRSHGMILGEFSRKNPKTLHQTTGAVVAERIFGECPEVVEAIRYHTTGKADMNLLQKIIYVADYMEPNRDFPGVEELRRLAHEDIDKALELGLTMTIQMLTQQGREISPESREALAWLRKEE